MTATFKLRPTSEHPAVPPIRVLLVDDSKIVRSIFARVLQDSGQVAVIAEAESCADAVTRLRTTSADIILLDIEMPEKSGLDGLPEILAAANGARVLVVSSFVEENGPAAVRALSLGACDTLSKPGRTGFTGKFSESLVEKVVRLGRSGKSWPSRTKTNPAAAFEYSDERFVKPECIAIGASTGGIPIIYDIVRNLPDSLDCPVLITQHLPDPFMEFFARQLQSQTDRKVGVAVAGETILANRIYVSPGDVHLVCRKTQSGHVVEHLSHYAGSRYSPSVDALMESVAKAYGARGLAIILSGMGNDGVAGIAEIARNNGRVVVQDEDSSVVWGMPGAVVKAGLADAILAPAHLTRLLAQLGAL